MTGIEDVYLSEYLRQSESLIPVTRLESWIKVYRTDTLRLHGR